MAKSVNSKITSVSIRMYCLGTGDCFVIKFHSGNDEKFTMMIDCGSCQGTKEDFYPYIQNLAEYVNNRLDLLVITHEHNDHVNGFAKCKDIFANPAFSIKEAWFAWTENPEDPEGRASELQKKRSEMRMALSNAIRELKVRAENYKNSVNDDYYKPLIENSQQAFLTGLDTLKDINLGASGGNPLPGMAGIKAILEEKRTKVKYLEPGDTRSVSKLPGLKFHILGPPYDREQIFRDGKEGTDVHHKKMGLYESGLAVNAFRSMGNSDIRDKDLPFGEEYVVNDSKPSFISNITQKREMIISRSVPIQSTYNDPKNEWRKIDFDWLASAGSMALRLNSHINNTSLVIAIEDEESGKVLLFPGDAEFGSWESWHEIRKWNKKGPDGKHFVEDLLNRTVFYKVGHHLSYNGTALEKGIRMMESTEFAAMATLDRKRISSGWKSTMPNRYLLDEIIRKSEGKFFIMNEIEIKDRPSKTLDPLTLGDDVYEEARFDGTNDVVYKQYIVRF